MNFRFTAILFLVLLAMIGTLLVVTLLDDKPSVDQVLLEPLAGLKADDIELVELQRTEPAEEKVVFAKVGNRWELREGKSGRLDSGTVSRTIDALLKLKPTLDKSLTGNPSLHGLDKPTLKVTLRTNNQRSATLLVGDTGIGAEKAITYVATGDHADTPIAVRRSDIAALFRDGTKDGKAWQIAKWVSDYRNRRLMGLDSFDVVAQAKMLSITAGGKQITMVRTGNDWKFDAPPGLGFVDIAGDSATRPDVITGLRPLTSVVTGLMAAGVEDFIENPEPLDKYGLGPNDPNRIRIELTPAEGPADVLVIGKKVEGATPVKYYAQVPGESVVLKVLGDRIEALVKTVGDPKVLQDRTLVKELDGPRIDAVDSTMGGVTTKLRKVPTGGATNWVLYGGPSDPQLAGPAIANLIMEIAKPRLATEALTAPDAYFAPPELKSELKLWIDGFSTRPESKDNAIPAEPALKGPANMTFLVGKIEGDSGFVRRIMPDGSKVDFKVPAVLIPQLAMKRTDWFDLKFKEFSPITARRLVFNRGAEVFDLSTPGTPEADYPNGKWTFASPPALKDKAADTEKVGNLMSTLALTLKATSVVSETPNEAELKAWGLDPAAPRMKATVTTTDEKDKERVYLFGNETPDKAHVYFKFPNKSIVYQVAKVNLDAFLTQDIRDATPYRFDVTAVKKIKIDGWKKKLGNPITLELTKDGENWKVTSTPPFEVDAAKVRDFLNFFRALKIVAVIGKEEAVHGMNGAAAGTDPLVITFTNEKGETLAKVNLGNEADGGNSLFTWVDLKPQPQVFTVPSGLFRQFKDSGPDYFKK